MKKSLGDKLIGSLPIIVLAVVLFAVSPAVLSGYDLGLLAKFLCFGLVAVGIGLAWGKGGMLTLGQGVFFGIGAYVMAMHLKISDAHLEGESVPDFLRFGGDTDLPWIWKPFSSSLITVLGIIIVPVIVAVLLGLMMFKRRVKGPYFAILSQALAAAFAIYLVGDQNLGGSNGISSFNSFFGLDLSDPVNQRLLFLIVSVILVIALTILRQLVRSRYGELLVAVRDQEERVRFLGYDPAVVKVIAYGFAALLASVAGAMFVPVVGIISPSDIGVVPSISFLIGVAIGGRNSLYGPVVGAVAVAWMQSELSDSYPAAWTYIQGAIFIFVIGFFPLGLAGAVRFVRRPSADGQMRARDTGVGAIATDQARSGVAGVAGCGSGVDPEAIQNLAQDMVADIVQDASETPRAHGRTNSELLEVVDAVVSYDGRHVVDGVTFGVCVGEVRFLIGPNGAGKTTLIDAITGIAPSAGSIYLDGVQINSLKVEQIARSGVGRTFQTPSVFENLTVTQNLDIAAGGSRSWWNRLRQRTGVEENISRTLDLIGLGALGETDAASLSHGQKKWLEIGMLLVQNSRVLLLDEPVAGMNAIERDATGALLRTLSRQCAVVVVEHDMDFVRQFATSVTVLAAGQVISEGSVQDIQNDPEVQRVYLGETLTVGGADGMSSAGDTDEEE